MSAGWVTSATTGSAVPPGLEISAIPPATWPRYGRPARRNGGPLGGQRERDGAADSLAAAGDDGPPAVQCPCHDPLPGDTLAGRPGGSLRRPLTGKRLMMINSLINWNFSATAGPGQRRPDRRVVDFPVGVGHLLDEDDRPGDLEAVRSISSSKSSPRTCSPKRSANPAMVCFTVPMRFIISARFRMSWRSSSCAAFTTCCAETLLLIGSLSPLPLLFTDCIAPSSEPRGDSPRLPHPSFFVTRFVTRDNARSSANGTCRRKGSGLSPG